jgi:transcriptional regulator with XRE-family HTH domain
MQPTNIHKGKTPIRRHFIEEWAKHYNYRKADISREVGADKSLVGRWFNDGALPGPDYLEKLAALFHTETESLFRHPDEDWIAKFFRDRSDAERERAKEILSLAFPKTGTSDQ